MPWLGRLPWGHLLIVLSAVTGLVLCARPAGARSGREAVEGRDTGSSSRMVAVHVEGRGAAEVREAVEGLMPDGLSVLEPADFTGALRQVGLRGPVGPAIHSQARRRALLRVLHRAMGKVDAAALVLARVWVRRGRRALTVLLIDEEGQVAVEDTVPMGGDSDELGAALDGLLGEQLRALAPPPPAPPPAPPPVSAADEAGDSEVVVAASPPFVPHRQGRELFIIDGGMELGGRSFSYRDGVTDNLAPYHVFGVPAVTFGGVIYPLASSDVGLARDIGATVRYSQAFGLASEVADRSLRFATTFNRFAAGLRYRWRLGDDPRPVVMGLAGSLGFVNFTFEPDDARGAAVSDELASVEYLLLRAGLDVRIPLGRLFALMPSVGYQGPVAGGDVYRRFRDASLAAVDAGLRVALLLGRGVEMRVGAHYLRVFSAFSPEPGDRYVAGGALDELIMLQLTGAYRF